jgi:hypothetical protein
VLHDRGARVPADGPRALLGREGDVRALPFDLGVFLDPGAELPPPPGETARRVETRSPRE